MSAHDEPMAYPGGTNPPLPGGANIPPASEADIHLQRLLAGDVEEPFFRSLFRNIKEFINPPKLPPLEVTSQPVPVKDIWGFYGGQEKRAGVSSLLIHMAAIGLLLWMYVTALVVLIGAAYNAEAREDQEVAAVPARDVLGDLKPPSRTDIQEGQ